VLEEVPMFITPNKCGGFGTGLSFAGQDLQPATAAARQRTGVVAVGGVPTVGQGSSS
jgi:hypothetical protein